MELVIGVICGSAVRNVNCGAKNPSRDARAIFGKSFFSTFSLGVNMDMSQNKAPAPIALRLKREMDERMWLPVSSLQVTMLMPNMEYAMKQDR